MQLSYRILTNSASGYRLRSLDLSAARIHQASIITLIEAWWRRTQRNEEVEPLSITLRGSKNVGTSEVVSQCLLNGIPLASNGLLMVREKVLSLSILGTVQTPSSRAHSLVLSV